MPIVKVPQKHKFGIVSLSRVQQLLALSNQQDDEDTPTTRSHTKHQPITQAFVTKYNAKPTNARESMDVEIMKALQHAKFRAGIGQSNTPSSSSPSSLPATGKTLDVAPFDTSIAWLELALLCQCNGPLQQEILLTLAVSLNHSPLSTAHVQSLVYIAGLCYQWLKTDADMGDVLRTGELILLKVLFLISLRLYYHHLTGCLMDICTRDEIRQLKFDVEGFESKEKSYRHLPEALLHWKVSMEVGLLVCEQYSKSIHDFNIKSASSRRSSDPLDSSKVDENYSPPRSSSTASHGGSSISAVLWHSLDIWQCTKQRCEVLQEAIQDLLACSTDFSSEKWMEGVLAMSILCTTSQVNLDALNLVQSLAAGQRQTHSKTTPTQSSHPSCSVTDRMDKPWKTEQQAGSKTESKSRARHPPPPPPPAIKGTRFMLPSKVGSSDTISTKAPPSQSTANKVATLNVLGMQPDFNVVDTESIYTADQTVASYQTVRESKHQRLMKAASADDVKFVHNRFPRLLHTVQPRHLEASDYRTVLNSTMTASSVGTQSLIANESIPDALPSAEFSNIDTLLDLGSITTLDPVESLGKSMGLFNSNHSKNLNISISNLVSPGLEPSGVDLTSRDDLVPTTIPEGSVEDSSTGSSEIVRPLSVTAVTVSGIEGKGAADKKVKVGSEGTGGDLLIADGRSAIKPADKSPMQPQHVKLVIAPNSQPESRCTHYTHSTAPLFEGANMLGSQVHPSTVLRHSMLSSETMPPSSSGAAKRLPQFEHWPGEVALTYAMSMASIVIYGKTSLIQQTALEGPREEGLIGFAGGKGESGVVVRNFGLLALAEFGYGENNEETEENSPGISDWSIRHEAILGLSRVNKTCRSLPMKDGLSEVAWAKMVERQAAERDTRVLQAFSLAQVVPDMDKVIVSGGGQSLFSPLLAHIADELSELFLPSPPSSHCIIKPLEKSGLKPSKRSGLPEKKLNVGVIRSKVKADVCGPRPLAQPSFNTRTFDALNKIAREDWERHMLMETVKTESESEIKAEK